MGKRLHILIALVYNKNGIATWCIEATRALQIAGHQVTLLTRSISMVPYDVQPCAIETESIATRRSFFDKVGQRLRQWYSVWLFVLPTSAPLKTAYEELSLAGQAPQLVLVAQADFVWPNCPVPQWVVGRSWPISLGGYLGKMQEWKNLGWLNRLSTLWFWYRMDHKAYRYSTGVLAITKRLAADLHQNGYRTMQLYPCIASPQKHPSRTSGPSISLFSAALSLDDPRKHIMWMVEQLAALRAAGLSFTCTLAGHYTQVLDGRLRSLLPDIRLTGYLSREQVSAHMQAADIFLFSSLQENWGYVLVEAIAAGMVLFTPDTYPFDEINPLSALRYKVSNGRDFQEKCSQLLKSFAEWQEAARTPYQAFAHQVHHSYFTQHIEQLVGAIR